MLTDQHHRRHLQQIWRVDPAAADHILSGGFDDTMGDGATTQRVDRLERLRL